MDGPAAMPSWPPEQPTSGPTALALNMRPILTAAAWQSKSPSMTWTSTHMAGHRNTCTPTYQHHHHMDAAQPDTMTVPAPSRTKKIALQLSAMAYSLIHSTIENTDMSHQMPKKHTKILACFLLGLGSLGWGEWHILAPI